MPKRKRYTTGFRGGYAGKKMRPAGSGYGGPFSKYTRRTGRTPRNARIGGFLGIETKFFDVEAENDAFTATWAAMEPATTNLTAIAQGDGESNRDGRKYAIKSIHIKGFIEVPQQESQTAPIADQYCRIVLVLDTQTNGAQLTATDVMDGGLAEDTLAFRNLQFSKRFIVLFDKKITLHVGRANMNEGAVNLFASPTIRVPFSYNKTFSTPIQVLMSGTTADIANVTDNSIHMIGVSESTIATLSYQCRTRFVG